MTTAQNRGPESNTLGTRPLFRVVLLNDLAAIRDYINLALEGRRDIEAMWEDELPAAAYAEISALVTANHHINATLVKKWKSRFPKLERISVALTGFDDVEREACQEMGLEVLFAPDYSTDSVAELTVCLAISVLRKICQAGLSARAGDWDSNVIPGSNLAKRKIGILGTGRIGRAAAKRFVAMGCEVIGWSRTRISEFEEFGAYRDTPEDVFRQADIITLHLPLNGGTDGTRGFVSANRIRLMQQTAVLINTARSGLVDNAALASALVEGRIGGAGIDVFDQEPVQGVLRVQEDPLLSLDPRACNLVITPHVGFKTSESFHRLASFVLQNISGHPPISHWLVVRRNGRLVIVDP